ncbi:MAG: hypothetical protein RIS70_3160 [Planctomycetota bacterium]
MKVTMFAFVAVLATWIGLGSVAIAQQPVYSDSYRAAGQGEFAKQKPERLSLVGYQAATTQPCNDSCLHDCPPEGWTDCWYAYGGFMYMRLRDSEIAYAVPANGPITPGSSAVQTGPVRVLDYDYQPGYFVGFGKFLDDYTSFGVQYTNFHARTSDAVAVTPSDVVRSLVAHPSTFSAALDGLAANAVQSSTFDVLDFDYRKLLAYDYDYKINYVLGARLVQTEQAFSSTFQFNGTHHVDTDLDFYGAGVRIGLEGERLINGGMLVYGRTSAAFVAGEYRADYDQTHSNDVLRVDTSWSAGRTITMLDFEVGTGWVSCCGTWRATIGYNFSAWLNVVQTDEWIKGVQTNNFVDMTDQLTFDGLVTRIEARW